MVEESEWKRLPGKTKRRYQNIKTGEIISRRYFDEHYGRLAKQGLKTNEEQAKVNKFREGIEQLAKPARGRTIIKENDAEIRKQILEARKELEEQKNKEKLLIKKQNKKPRTPSKITLKNFKPGTEGRVFRVHFDFDDISNFINVGKAYQGIFAYGVGIEFFNELKGNVGAATLFKHRHITVPFTQADFDYMRDWISNRNSNGTLIPLFAFVRLELKKEYYEKLGKRKKK